MIKDGTRIEKALKRANWNKYNCPKCGIKFSKKKKRKCSCGRYFKQ
jgi:hypothetical protein